MNYTKNLMTSVAPISFVRKAELATLKAFCRFQYCIIDGYTRPGTNGDSIRIFDVPNLCTLIAFVPFNKVAILKLYIPFSGSIIVGVVLF
jgi:hypothetical protein